MEYDRPDVVTAREGTDELCISEAEVLQAIGGLKNNKAVPVDSLTAEIWKLCHRECASYLHRVQQGVHDGHKYPREVSDSALALLPGPGKPSKQPGDSRPLGLQDPCSKLNTKSLNKPKNSLPVGRNTLTVQAKYRVRLYVSCVRSTMLFGQRALGLTKAVLYKLEQADARALRAISCSSSFFEEAEHGGLAPTPCRQLAARGCVQIVARHNQQMPSRALCCFL